MLLQRYPVFRVFLALCLGILLANFTQVSFGFFLVLGGISVPLTLLFAAYRPVFFSFRYRWAFGLAVWAAFFAVGGSITHLYGEKHSCDYLKKLPDKKVYAQVQLLEDPQQKDRSVGMKVRLQALGTHPDSLAYKSLKVMLYLEKDTLARQLKYGDRILIHTYINALQPPKNPYEFDYRDFLQLKAIYAQAYADSGHWKKLSSGHGWPVLSHSKTLRRYLLGTIDGWGLSAAQTAVSKALLLGYRYDIDDTTLKAYASAGAMHVLAVSGLHVGIVYIMAGYLLFFMMKIRHGATVKSVLLILMLWGFAMLTGLSASVVRAATMFTFVAIATGFQRKTSIYNTILGSAILLLIIKPTYLFEVGFQLSYAAVFGIVWMQPHLSRIWAPPNKILKLIWDITTVSMAAQLATFPLGLYYFHQFPTLFLLSNLVVIPIVTALMYLGVPVLVMSSLGITWLPMIKIYGGLLWLMNAAVLWIEQQATFLITEIHITRWELVLLYVIIISGFWWLISGGYRRAVVTLAAILLLGGSQMMEKYEISTTRKLVFYAVKGHSAIGIYNGSQNLFMADTALLYDDDALTFHVKHHWWAMDASPQLIPTDDGTMDVQRRYLQAGNTLVYRMAGGERVLPRADYVLAMGVPAYRLKAIAPCTLVLAGQLSYYEVQKWRAWCEAQQMPYHDVSVAGALQVNY